MEMPQSLTSMPPEVLAMILEEYFKTATIYVIEKDTANQGSADADSESEGRTDGDPADEGSFDDEDFTHERSVHGYPIDEDSTNEDSDSEDSADENCSEENLAGRDSVDGDSTDGNFSDESSTLEDFFKNPYLDTRHPPCMIDNSGHGLAILRTCKKLYTASQPFLSAEFLAQHVTFCHVGCIIPLDGGIQVGRSIVYGNDMEKISGDGPFAYKLQGAWSISKPLYPKVRELMVHFCAEADVSLPSLGLGPLEALLDLNVIGTGRQIDLRIFVDIASRLRSSPSMKVVVRGNDAEVYEMKQMGLVEYDSLRSTIQSKFLCRLVNPTISLGKDKVVRKYRDKKVRWQEW